MDKDIPLPAVICVIPDPTATQELPLYKSNLLVSVLKYAWPAVPAADLVVRFANLRNWLPIEIAPLGVFPPSNLKYLVSAKDCVIPDVPVDAISFQVDPS